MDGEKAVTQKPLYWERDGKRAKLEAENKQLRDALWAARARVKHDLGDIDGPLDCLTLPELKSQIDAALGINQQQARENPK